MYEGGRVERQKERGSGGEADNISGKQVTITDRARFHSQLCSKDQEALPPLPK